MVETHPKQLAEVRSVVRGVGVLGSLARVGGLQAELVPSAVLARGVQTFFCKSTKDTFDVWKKSFLHSQFLKVMFVRKLRCSPSNGGTGMKMKKMFSRVWSNWCKKIKYFTRRAASYSFFLLAAAGAEPADRGVALLALAGGGGTLAGSPDVRAGGVAVVLKNCEEMCIAP